MDFFRMTWAWFCKRWTISACKNISEFEIFNFVFLCFGLDGETAEEFAHLKLAREIKNWLGSVLINAKSWHQPLTGVVVIECLAAQEGYNSSFDQTPPRIFVGLDHGHEESQCSGTIWRIFPIFGDCFLRSLTQPFHFLMHHWSQIDALTYGTAVYAFIHVFPHIHGNVVWSVLRDCLVSFYRVINRVFDLGILFQSNTMCPLT